MAGGVASGVQLAGGAWPAAGRWPDPGRAGIGGGALSGRSWRELQRRGAACGFTEMAAGGDLREKRAPGLGRKVGAIREAADEAGRPAGGGGAGRSCRGGRRFQKTATADGASLKGWGNCCKGWFGWEGYFFLEGFFFKGL